MIELCPLKVLSLILFLRLDLLIDILEYLQFGDFGRFAILIEVTGIEGLGYDFDGLFDGDVITIKNGEESSFEYLFVLFLVFFIKTSELFPEVTQPFGL